MFTVEDRDRVREQLIARAEADAATRKLQDEAAAPAPPAPRRGRRAAKIKFTAEDRGPTWLRTCPRTLGRESPGGTLAP
jgi:hypothetical protein